MPRKARKYNKFYMVCDGIPAVSIRVTRDSGRIYRTVDFFPSGVSLSGRAYGTLVLDEATWERWKKEGEVILPGYETARSAALQMVKRPEIYFGCPLCSYRGKDIEKYHNHVEACIGRFTDVVGTDDEEEAPSAEA